MDRHSVDWRGYFVAATTPFAEDGGVDVPAFARLMDWYVDQGMHGIVVTGSTGEWTSLTMTERVALFEAAATQVRGRVPVIAGCSAFTAQEVAELGRAAKEHGLDGIMATPPPYVLPTRRETVAFYQHVSDSVPMPLILYNRPQCTGVELTSMLEELADIDTVVAVKNSTGNQGWFLQQFFNVGDRIRYFGFPQNKLGATLVREHGADGSIAAMSMLGAAHPAFYNLVWKGDVDGALRHGEVHSALFSRLFTPDFASRFSCSAPAVHKCALDAVGAPGGGNRPPVLPPTPEEVETITAAVQDAQRQLTAFAAV